MSNFIYELSEGREITTIEDFFEFLNRNTQKGTFAYAYYTYPVKVNATLGKKGAPSKEPNPYFGRIFKHSRYEFRWEDTYSNAKRRTDPDYQFVGDNRIDKSSGALYKSVEGVKMIEQGPNGLYLPIVPTKFFSPVYTVDADIVPKEQIIDQLPTSNGILPEVMKLIVERIAGLSAGGAFWKNPDFKYTYAGEKSEKFQ